MAELAKINLNGTEYELKAKNSDQLNGQAASYYLNYNNFTNKPTIGQGTLTIQKNGSNVATFGANSTSNVTANITVPTKISELTNDSNYAKKADLNSYLSLSGGALTGVLKGGAIDVHPENGGTVIGYYTNDLAYLLDKGGSCVATNITRGTSISVNKNWFDASPSYGSFNVTATTDVVQIIIKSPVVYSWGTVGGIGFGSTSWRAKSVKMDMGYSATNKGTASNPDSDIKWVTRINKTGNADGLVYGNCSGPSASEGGISSTSWSYIRFTLTDWNSTGPRIAQIFTINYGSSGMHNAFLSKGGGSVYGSITPYANNSYNLGSSSLKWANIYATNIYENGTALSSKYLSLSGGTVTGDIRISNGGSGEDQQPYIVSDTNDGETIILLPTSTGDTVTLATDEIATKSSKGLMSNTDKTKLDGIATGATKVTTDTVSGWGYTKNTGTVTQVKVGTTAYNPSSGVVSLPSYPSIPTSLKNPNSVTIKAGTDTISSYDGSAAKTFTFAASTTNGAFTVSDGTTTKTIQLSGKFTDTDTKNTAGSTNSTSKLFLVGATSQGANPQTYSYSTVYETSGTLNATKFTVDAEHTGGTIQYNTTNGCMEIIC